MSDKPFNIRQLNGLDYDEAEPLLEDYQETLIELFVNSTEGEEYCKTIQTLDFGFRSSFITVSAMKVLRCLA